VAQDEKNKWPLILRVFAEKCDGFSR